RLLADAAAQSGRGEITFPVVNPLGDALPEGISLLDAHAFCEADGEALPASWDATSDSIAARVTLATGASLLVLLKSTDRPRGSWQEAVRRGVVDPLFIRTLARGKVRMPASPPVVLLNFREPPGGPLGGPEGDGPTLAPC